MDNIVYVSIKDETIEPIYYIDTDMGVLEDMDGIQIEADMSDIDYVVTEFGILEDMDGFYIETIE
jgi:hypothetical protein